VRCELSPRSRPGQDRVRNVAPRTETAARAAVVAQQGMIVARIAKQLYCLEAAAPAASLALETAIAFEHTGAIPTACGTGSGTASRAVVARTRAACDGHTQYLGIVEVPDERRRETPCQRAAPPGRPRVRD
jgi:hypothetical protein